MADKSENMFGRMAARSRRSIRCERGAILVQSVVFATLLLGAAGLAVDFGRYYTLNVQMQSYADHVALAAASELDRKTGAILRARRIVEGYSDGAGGSSDALLIKESPFMDNVDEMTIEQVLFLSDLPDDPEPGSADYPIGDLADLTTEDSSEAKFVLVVVQPESVRFSFSAFLSLFDSDAAAGARTNAVAVATLEQEICNVPPLMMCNPWETTSGSFPSDEAIRGTQILAKTAGPGAAWAPGNFGFLATAFGAGDPICNGAAGSAARIRCVFALNEPNTACVNTTVDTSPGQAISVYKGMNVRFDMWSPPLSRNTATMTPAPNTIKGQVPQSVGQCAQHRHDPATESVALPRDTCLVAENCPVPRIGNKVTRAQLETYWATNHGEDPALRGDITTRYETYKYELELHKAGLLSLDALGPSGGPVSDEHGTPFCYNGGVAYGDLDEERRNMIMAVINCIEEGISGSANDVEVERFLEVFMTEPATEPGAGNSDTDTNGSDLWVEVVRVVEAGGNDGILHAYPVLVR